VAANVAVIVPQYKEELSDDDAISLRHLLTHLGERERYVVVPESLRNPLEGFRVLRYPDRFFTGRARFGTLLMRSGFYRNFASYEHVLVHHLDALVLSDRLDEFCAGAYDYVGAPWIDAGWIEGPAVGNGGFSLRRVEACLKVLESRRYALGGPEWNWRAIGPRQRGAIRYRRGGHCDIFWSFDAPKRHPEFRIAPVEAALRFAWELRPRVCLELAGGELPFGCHGWTRSSREFWEPHLLG
jgi:hypothetical protein